MMRVIRVSGYHNSGKTTVVECIIKELHNRGFTVSTIKNIHIDGWTIDQEDKDSRRHVLAGAEAVGITAKKETVVIFPGRKKNLEEMLPFFNSDFLILEGYQKRQDLPNIACGKTIDDINPLITRLTFCISGIISKSSAISFIEEVPVFNALQNGKEITDLVVENSLEM